MIFCKAMIVHRFMSSEEYERLVNGETLENHRHHAKGGAESVGFCFTQEAPELAIRWLSGIVDTDYCVTFRVRDKGLLRKVHATYRDPTVPIPMTGPLITEGMPTMTKEEYCCERYSSKQLKIVRQTTRFNTVPGHRLVNRLLGAMGYTENTI